VAGSGPFQATTPQALIACHLRDVPKPLSAVRPDVDPEFERLVAACLEKDPARRPSAAQVGKQLTPGGGVALEWPPPGLERLRGALGRWSRLLWAGTVLAVGAALTFVLSKPGETGEGATTGYLVLALAGALGTLVLLAAATRAASDLRRASSAVHRGYTWRTVLEAMADGRADTGALMAGAREYAGLDTGARNTLRRFRLARAALLVAGGALAGPLLLLSVRLASHGALGAGAVAALASGLPALALLGAVVLSAIESRAVRARRKALRHRSRKREDAAHLVEPWYVSFESVRGPDGLGRGRPGGDVTGWVGGVGAALVLALAALVVIPLWLLGVLAPQAWTVWAVNLTIVRQKTQSVELVRRFAVPVDSTVTALAAGRAFYTLSEIGHDSAHPAGPFRQHPLPRRLPPLPELSDSALFPVATGWRGPDDQRILAMALRGFSPAQERWLAGLAAHPVWTEWGTVARAPTFDYVGARFAIPFPRDADLWSMPVARFAGPKTVAYANTVRAAWFLARGRRAEAEHALRETVSVGLQMVDHGRTVLDAMIGVVIAGIGRRALEQLFSLTGRPEAQRLRDAAAAWQARLDSTGATTDVDTERIGRMTPRQLRRLTLSLPWDRTLPLGLRFEEVRRASLAPCTDVEEMVFGPAADVRAVFGRARRELARFPSDSALIGLLERDAQEGPRVYWDVWGPEYARRGALEASLYAALRATGRLLGNPRLARCSEVALGAWM
jgi:hypothetical protein